LHDWRERRPSSGSCSEPCWNRELDTRNKIKPLKDLHSVLADSKWTVVVGLFDPLTAVARAELVAALRGVNAVIVATPDTWRSAIPSDSDFVILDDLPAERRRSGEFVKFILERQGLS